MKENQKFNQKTFEKSFVIKNYKKNAKKRPKISGIPAPLQFLQEVFRILERSQTFKKHLFDEFTEKTGPDRNRIPGLYHDWTFKKRGLKELSRQK